MVYTVQALKLFYLVQEVFPIGTTHWNVFRDLDKAQHLRLNRPFMMRYYFFSFLLGLALRGRSQNVDLPNIIFITVDDLGWADLGCYGADLHETPNIDALAATSTLFTNSYAAAPVCSPTRASIMTGKTPAHLRWIFLDQW